MLGFIKEDLLKVVSEFHTNGKISKAMNSTFISLIPKKSGWQVCFRLYTDKFGDRPTQIIGKLLSNRVKEVLQEIIDCNQFAFNKGKKMLDSVLIGHECIEDYKRKKKKGCSQA